MNPNPSQSNLPKEAVSAAGDIYETAITREGLVASKELVIQVVQLHRATLTAGLVLRAYNTLRRARIKTAKGKVEKAEPSGSGNSVAA